MSSVEPTEPAPGRVPYKDTGHPFRDWIAWKIANTPPGQPAFPMLRDLMQALLAFLMKQLSGSIAPKTW